VIIEFHNVTKLYDRYSALRDFSVNVPEGSAFALVGANGAGKTTAIKCFVGIDSRRLSSRELSRIGYVTIHGLHQSPVVSGVRAAGPLLIRK
jgi:ABC-2 type transport system ATP-binding protein